jgi:DNA-directed RNA polymerase subunit RPC12/RpoP
MKCPGQDSQYWKSDAVFEVKCPKCSGLVEFFKDDTSRRCGQCGHRFVNPKMDFGCAAYCQYAEQCLGDLPPELAARQEDLLKDRVAVAVKRYLKTDFKQIGHITRRARYAEEMANSKEVQTKLPVVLITALLWDLDADRDGGDTPVARSILNDLKAPPPLIEQVCKLIASRTTASTDGAETEFNIVADAEARAAEEEAAKAKAL